MRLEAYFFPECAAPFFWAAWAALVPFGALKATVYLGLFRTVVL